MGESLTYRYRLVVYEGNDFRAPLVEQAMKDFGPDQPED